MSTQSPIDLTRLRQIANEPGYTVVDVWPFDAASEAVGMKAAYPPENFDTWQDAREEALRRSFINIRISSLVLGGGECFGRAIDGRWEPDDFDMFDREAVIFGLQHSAESHRKAGHQAEYEYCLRQLRRMGA